MPALSARSCTTPRLLASLILLACLTHFASAVGCKVTPAPPASEADKAFSHGNYDQAAILFRQQFQKDPGDPNLAVHLAMVLLRQQKFKEAEQLVQGAIAIKPNSVLLLTALAQVQYGEGNPRLAAATADTASKLDPCYPQLHFVNAMILTINSNYGAASHELRIASLLEPRAGDFFNDWTETLPLAQRISAVETHIAGLNDISAENMSGWQQYLSQLKKTAAEPRKSCRLVSPMSATTVDFVKIMRDATHMEAFGLPVKFNGHEAHLEIDTGASGLVISHAMADRAGLKRIDDTVVSGIGGKGARAASDVYADDIKIGALEFHDCKVQVVENHSALETDGLIGTDVFSRFLVTLDYPVRKLILGPLPPRPGDTTPPAPTLETASSSSANPSSPVGDSATSAAPERTATRGPQDRYVAPEMKDWTRVYHVGHDLIVPAILNDTRQKLFVLDTGAFTTTISPAAAAEVTRVHSDDFNQVKGIGGKVDRVYYAEKINFKFANLSQDIEDVVSFDTSNLSQSLGMDISGLIGFTALAQTTMSIDYRDGLVNFSFDPHRGYSTVPYR